MAPHAQPSEPLPTPDDMVPAAAPPGAGRPRLRGVIHQWSFFVALAAGAALVAWAPAGRATLACAVYAVGLAGLLGTSALYHRVTWRPRARAWLRRLDHSMIFVLIAGTYTPFGVLVLDGSLQVVVLAGVWAGAAAGIVLALVWIDAPKWLTAATYVALGWFSLVALPQITERAGAGAVALLAAGGAAYTAGAVVYARRRPDPRPDTFGYHEIFHVLVVAAAAAHFVAVAAFAVPQAD
jgi:hemolysin III